MTRFAFPCVVAVFALLGPTLAVRGDDSRLLVVQDETSMERVIARYLTNTHQLTMAEKTLKAGDVYLEKTFTGGSLPRYRLQIDTWPLNKGRGGQVLERGVLLHVYTGVVVPKQKRFALLDIVNLSNQRKTFSSVVVDPGGEIQLSWTLNVLSAGLATENVYDAVARLQALWQGLYPTVVTGLKA